MLQPGIQGRCERLVTQDLTAQAMGSGALPVLATPALAAMMEQAAWESVQPYLDAVKLAPERVRAFLAAILTRTQQTRQHEQPVRREQDMEL